MFGILIISVTVHSQKKNLEEDTALNFQTHFFEALKQRAINNYSKAIESLEKCAEIDKENDAVEFEFSKNHLLLKNYDQAEVFINKALKSDPNNIYLLQHKVKINKAQGDLKEAIEDQKRIVEMQPKLSNDLVLLYIQNKNYKLAEGLIENIDKNALSTTKTNFYKAFLEKRKEPQKNSSKSNTLSIENADIETLRKLYTKKKDFKVLKELLIKEAKEEVFDVLNTDSRMALELFPAQPIVYKMNGLALLELGKYNESISVLRIGIEFVIDDTIMEADFYELLSRNYLSLNKNSEAIKYKQKAEALRKQQ
jgi:tetratricopeptide (TPR) repeat protein